MARKVTLRVFPPSTIPHPWRQTFALIAVVFWLCVAVAWFVTGPFLWLLQQGGPIDWQFGRISG